jgi:two-component system response regulator FlrC
MDKNIIIVINEDFLLLSAISEIIKELSYTPVMFHNPKEALKYLEKTTPYLVVTDLFFKDMEEGEIWNKLKENIHIENILIVSPKISNELGTKVMREGAIDYIIAPVEKEQLKLILAKLKLKNKKIFSHYREFITRNQKMQSVLKIVESAAKSRSTVLIRGESGVGKELIARMIHEKSNRHNAPFVAINCAALPETLLESELFGHEKGSFTGAISTKQGKFEIANNGTILLDEITEMAFPLQAKLLRVLQEREIDRVGGKDTIKIDIRVIATTNRNMKEFIKEKKFREDLYYRLNVIPIIIPPLRERLDDIPILAEYFIKKHCELNSIPEKKFNKNALEKLSSYHWPGNVRELENIVERAVIICPNKTIDPDYILFEDDLDSLYSNEFFEKKEQFNPTVNTEPSDSLKIKPGLSISEMERKLIIETLKHVNDNRTVAAELLGISVRTLRNKLNEYKNSGLIL